MNLILHFDSVYQAQSLPTLLPDTKELDFTCMEGVHGYCDETSAALLRNHLKPISADGIHFIGSGNYHYMSLFFLEKILFPFSLVVFDHHTDMQPSMFGDLLSCGSWILNALKNLPSLKEILIIGVGEESLNGTKEITLIQPEFSVVCETENFLQCRYHDRKKDASITILKENQKEQDILYKNYIHFPCYLSIDKDVLSRKELETDWDQGSLSMEELKNICKKLFYGLSPIGIDICGEPDMDMDLFLSKKINTELISLFCNQT